MAVKLIVRAVARREQAALRISIAFGSSTGAAAAAAFLLVALAAAAFCAGWASTLAAVNKAARNNAASSNAAPGRNARPRISSTLITVSSWYGSAMDSAPGRSGNHSAIEHLVHDGTGDLIEECLAHLLVVAQEIEN